MNFLKHSKVGITKVYIENSIDQESVDEIKKLVVDFSQKYEIYLMNLDTLNKEVILLFSKLTNAHFFVNEKNLCEYLQNLSFKVTLKDPYSIPTKHFDYCVLAGSAGSIEKTLKIIKMLPPSSMTFFIVLHQRDKADSKLVEVIQKCNENYIVKFPESNEKIKDGYIYIAPPGKHMILISEYIFLHKSELVNYARPSIAVFFKSLTESIYCERTLIIMLCGYGHDGVEVLNTLLEKQATILVHDPEECEAKDLLVNSIEQKSYTHIMKNQEIIDFLMHYIEGDDIEINIEGFLEKIYQQYGYDFKHYKKPHMQRRIKLFYQRTGIKSFDEFSKMIIDNKDFFHEFFYHLSINISAFFRNPMTYKFLREFIAKKYTYAHEITIWSAGCSAGEEPYTIAMLFEEIGFLEKTRVYATDHNSIVLAQAKNGLYSKAYMQSHFLDNYTQSGGKKEMQEYYTIEDDLAVINNSIKEKVIFFNHSLVHDSKFNSFNVILCRNVLIYFDNALKKRVIKLFYDSLVPFGILILGESEFIDDSGYFTVIDKKNNIYQKVL